MATITTPGRTLIPAPSRSSQDVESPGEEEGSQRLTAVYPVLSLEPHLIFSGVTYEIDASGFAYNEVDFDSYDDCIRTAEKEFDEGLLFVDSIPLGALLAALKCRPGSLGGGSVADYEARAQRRLLRLESTFLEKKLEAHVLAGSNATVVAPGADIRTSIAKLVNQNIDNPTLHISVETAVNLGAALDNIEDAGVELVISPVYSSATAFLTGAVITWAGDVQVNNVPDVTHNYTMALAERQYIMAIEPGGGSIKPFKVTLP